YHLMSDQVLVFEPGREDHRQTFEVIKGLDNPRLDEIFPLEMEHLRMEVELVKGASHTFDMEAFLAGQQTPVFFGSAINNFGVREILNSLVEWAPSPGPRDATIRGVLPDEKPFSGFVFKIQANMDPAHRDRIAFVRVCSGRFERGMKVRHLRLDRDMKVANVITFMAHQREQVEEAYAGDIIGIHNHGNVQIGDSFSEGENLQFTGIPYFAPELFRSVRIRNPIKVKQLHKGLQQLGEEGAVQVFKMVNGSSLILGAVGALQFDVVAHRLQAEYGVDAVFESCDIYTARWVTCDDSKVMAEFERKNAHNIALDAAGNLAYFASSRFNLELTEEKWPQISFHATREHAARLG
ncbi:MAG: peptide chain release factor 3, partial [Nitrospirota bacterium]|nr:peptide chain release factor 3 [Nitrospirota bacterium]